MDGSAFDFLSVDNSLTVMNNPRKLIQQPYHDRVNRPQKFKANLDNLRIDPNKLRKFGLVKYNLDKSFNSLKTSINATQIQSRDSFNDVN